VTVIQNTEVQNEDLLIVKAGGKYNYRQALKLNRM
jgi:hypothetical protein